MTSRQYSKLWASAALGLILLALLAGCSEDPSPASLDQSWSGVCIDLDGDGFGFQCGAGYDCDDHDGTLHRDCGCKRPDQGCACDDGAAPVACQLPHSLDVTGALICSAGTRYCRDATWSACEGVASYLVPSARNLSARARIDRDAAAVVCDPCNPDCYRVEDPLRPEPDGSLGPGLVSAANGGITLAVELTDAAADAGAFYTIPDGGVVDEQPCQSAEDGDCDGLPTQFDADPDAGERHRALFYPLGTGAQATRTLQSPIAVGSADIYVYLDATSSMAETHARLVADLRTGNFLPDAGAGLDCFDHDGDGAPDNELKEQGVAGNLACTVRDLQFGTGFFRDIPFVGPLALDGRMIAPSDYEMFEHRLDITPDVDRLDQALQSIGTRSNYNVPEGSMQGLWALATGREVYAGWNRPGIPGRRDCPLRTWGYPCFRDAAMALVIQLTDAPMQNGPATAADSATNPPTPADCLSSAFEYNSTVACAPLIYDEGVLGALSSGTEITYRALTQPAETVTDAEPVGNVDDTLITYAGDTRTMSADLTYAQLGFSCAFGTGAWSRYEQGSPDAVFRFTVTGSDPFILSARGSRFDTSLMLLRADASGQPQELVACADDSLPFPNDSLQRDDAAELQRVLPAGDYIVVLKGYTSSEQGIFQLTLGRPGLQQPRLFDARRWSGVGGVRAVLRESAMRVITVQAGNDPYAQQQARALAQATDTLDSSGAPISGLMDGDNNIGDEIVDTVLRTLAGASMTISLRIVQAFGDPDPELPYQVEAVDWPGDGCEPPIDLNGDGAPDAHPQCRAGARPRFNLTFSNPTGLAHNLSDPTGQGGYRLWAQVLGDGRFVLDEYPVYIVSGAPLPPPPPLVAASTYQELVEAKGCMAGEVPSWRTQYWDATLPEGTRVSFSICTADSEDDARACTPVEVAALAPAGPCNAQADCGTTGYCDVSRVCHNVTGADCMNDEDCGLYGLCSQVGGRQACTFTRNAADLQALSVALQARRFANVRIDLRSNEAHTQAPTIHRWLLDYNCAVAD